MRESSYNPFFTKVSTFIPLLLFNLKPILTVIASTIRYKMPILDATLRSSIAPLSLVKMPACRDGSGAGRTAGEGGFYRLARNTCARQPLMSILPFHGSFFQVHCCLVIGLTII